MEKKFPKCAFFRHKDNKRETDNCDFKEDIEYDVDIYEYYINFLRNNILIFAVMKIYIIFKMKILLIKLDNNFPSNIIKLQQDFNNIIIILNGKLNNNNNKFLTIKLYDLNFYEGNYTFIWKKVIIKIVMIIKQQY